jgi:hypothetical protein
MPVFTPPEQDVVFLSVAVENEWHYCAVANSFVADNMTKVPEAITKAIRNGSKLPDSNYRALSTFTRTMVKKQGNPTQSDVN